MTWLDKNKWWLERARERWSPLRHPECFTVRMWFSSPVAWSEHGVQLDGLLQRIVVERETGMASDDVFAECPKGLNPEIQIPIIDVTIADTTISCASWGVPPRIAIESLRWRRKRARLEALAGNRVTIAGGPYKSTNIPVPVLVTPFLDFHLVGCRAYVMDLLRDATAIGRGYSSGLGTILGTESMHDHESSMYGSCRALVWQGKPMRSIPIGPGMPKMDDPFIRLASTRAPYWANKNPRVCAVPALHL